VSSCPRGPLTQHESRPRPPGACSSRCSNCPAVNPLADLPEFRSHGATMPDASSIVIVRNGHARSAARNEPHEEVNAGSPRARPNHLPRHVGSAHHRADLSLELADDSCSTNLSGDSRHVTLTPPRGGTVERASTTSCPAVSRGSHVPDALPGAPSMTCDNSPLTGQDTAERRFGAAIWRGFVLSVWPVGNARRFTVRPVRAY
jgi:hypothetical protein